MTSTNDDSIDLLGVFAWLSENWISIVIFPIAFALAGFGSAYAIKPTYTARYDLTFPSDVPAYLRSPIMIAAIREAAPARVAVGDRSVTFSYSSASQSSAVEPVEAVRRLAISTARELAGRTLQEITLVESEGMLPDQFLRRDRSTPLEMANHVASLSIWIEEETLKASTYTPSHSPRRWAVYGFLAGIASAFIFILVRTVRRATGSPAAPQ